MLDSPLDDPLLRSLTEIARSASKLIMEIYERGFDVNYKGPGDPVTTVDREANRLICEQLAHRFPGAPIVAEESDPNSYAAFSEAPEAFFVDPIDGTRELVARRPEFVVMIGLAREGSAHAGIVFDPVEERAWLGTVGGGAFCINKNEPPSRIATTAVDRLEAANLLVSRSHDASTAMRAASALGIGKVHSLGSAGLKGALVAQGEADLYLSPGCTGQRWDACAIDAIVTAAGGIFTDSYGRRLDYRRPNLKNDAGLIASNTPLHPLVIERLQSWRSAPRV